VHSERKVFKGCRPLDVVTVDFNRDGWVDLAVACEDGLLLLSGRREGTFAPGPQWPDPVRRSDFLYYGVL
jgi:hypothetical protein